MARHPILLDCDPGQDDAVAILLALAAEDALETIALTTVAGNVPLDRTTDNALRLVELAGAEVPVHAGADRPLLRPLVTAEQVHGPTGIDGADLPPTGRRPAAGHAACALVDAIRSRPPASVTLVATGPLTNLALAFRLAPDLPGRLRRVAIMGGAIGLGNVTPAAEFNFHVDPHAARIVFESGADIVLFPLDVTHQVRVTEERLARIRAVGNPAARAVAGMLAFYRGRNPEGGPPQAPLHDPCPVAWLLEPQLFRGRRAEVTIETDSPLGLGRSYVDFRSADPNALVMEQADAEGLFALLCARLARL